MKIKKILLTIFTLIPLVFYTYLLYTQKLQESYFFFAYNTLIIFTLPFLIARLSATKDKFFYNSIILFLIYPTTYLVAFIIAKLTPLNLEPLLSIISVLLVFKWNTILLVLIQKLDPKELTNILKQGLYIIPMILLYIATIFIIRDLNSIVALDYLQHYAVTTRMNSGDMLCIVPNQCSELFIQVGYTTIYHTILGFLTSFSNNNPVNAIYIIDFVYPLIIGLLTFSFLKRFNKNLLFVSILAVSSLFIFINGAYESTFFLPQTLAYIFFLIALSIKKLNWKTLVAISTLLIVTHFVVGIYLALLLIGKYILIDKMPLKTLKIFYKYILLFACLTPLILLIANSSGFSIENTFQSGATEMIGGVTNMPFPYNLWGYLSIWGGTGLFVLFSIIFQKNKLNRWYLYSVIYISTTLSIFLLEPTYATKFLIGAGLFSIILVLKYLKTLENPTMKILATMLVLISLLPTYYFNKLDYLDFYKQNNAVASAYSEKDAGVIQFTQNLPSNCIYVSDPLTQILLESLGEQRTARAQYITPDSRKKIFEFVQEPSENTYEGLRNIEELRKRNMCFVYSSRLHTSLEKDDVYWLFHMYSIIVDNSVKLDNTVKLTDFMQKKGYEVTYDNEHFIVFQKI